MVQEPVQDGRREEPWRGGGGWGGGGPLVGGGGVGGGGAGGGRRACARAPAVSCGGVTFLTSYLSLMRSAVQLAGPSPYSRVPASVPSSLRSEEHTSEIQ